MSDQTAAPTAVPNPPAAGVNTPPPSPPALVDPALDGFQKIAAERRSRLNSQPAEVPFGVGTIRIHTQMPAGFAFDAMAAEVDPFAARRMLKSVIVEADHEKFEQIMLLPPDNAEGVDGKYLVDFLGACSAYYGGVPLAD